MIKKIFRNNIMNVGVVVIILILINSCSTPDEVPTLVVGEDFTNTRIRVLSIDTLEVSLSTMKFDSILTSNSGRLLFGRYEDNNFGKITSAPYFVLNASRYFIDSDAVLDSIGLILSYDKYFYNDTTQILNLNVHKVLENFETDDGNFYNTSTFDYEPIPLSSISFFPEPNRDSIYVPLPLEFGADIIAGIKNNELVDFESFRQFLNGITLQPNNTDNGSVIGFNVSESYLKLYYRIPDELSGEEREFEIAINEFGTQTYFNHIESDVSNLPLSEINDQENVLLSTESNNVCYSQSGVGYVTRIEFPNIKKLNEIPGTVTILNAVLEIKPTKNSYSNIKPLPSNLNLFFVDQNNDLAGQNASIEGATIARLDTTNEEFGEVYYLVPVLEFADLKFLEEPITETALILLPTEFNSSVNSILFNDALSSDFKARLILTYAVLDEEDD